MTGAETLAALLDSTSEFIADELPGVLSESTPDEMTTILSALGRTRRAVLRAQADALMARERASTPTRPVRPPHRPGPGKAE